MPRVHTVPLHLGDFITDTTHLSPAEVGAYFRLLSSHYRMGVKGLPDDDAQLRRITGMDNKTWKSSRATVMDFFELDGDRRWVHARVQTTLLQIAQKQEQNRAKALKRWKPPDATASVQHSHGTAAAMRSISQKPRVEGEPSTPPSPPASKLPHQELPEGWKRWAIEDRGWDEQISADVWTQFREYWTTGKGRSQKKTGWEAAWRNWCRKEHIKPKGISHAPAFNATRQHPAKPSWGSEGERLRAKYAAEAEREEQGAARGAAGESLRLAEGVWEDAGGAGGAGGRVLVGAGGVHDGRG